MPCITNAHENDALQDIAASAGRVWLGYHDRSTEGTWEFQPGVRLNKNQMPVIDHAVSHQPPMPQRGAAKEPESLNWSLRKRELQRITQENQGIVTRIQGRGSSFPTQSQWAKRSEEHDQYLMLLRRPVTRDSMPTPPSPYVGPRGARRLRTPQSGKRTSSARAGRPDGLEDLHALSLIHI